MAAAHPGVGTFHQASSEPYGAGPGRVRLQPSLVVAAAGCAAMAFALVLTVLGVPAALFYERDEPGRRNQNSSWDMLTMSRSIDQNMKYIKTNTGYEDGQYNYYIRSINKAEDAIPVLAKKTDELTISIKAIDSGLTGTYRSTVQMRKDMQAMAATTGKSARTMTALGTDIGELSGAMGRMYLASLQLTRAMAGIEQKAGTIADKRTNVALATTRRMNGSLPDRVPEPVRDVATLPMHQEGAL